METRKELEETGETDSSLKDHDGQPRLLYLA